MKRKRRIFSASQKTRIALEAIKERQTGAEIAVKYEVHPNQVSQWKKEALAGMEEVFIDKRKRQKKESERADLTDKLYSQIGQLQFELNWLKKKIGED